MYLEFSKNESVWTFSWLWEVLSDPEDPGSYIFPGSLWLITGRFPLWALGVFFFSPWYFEHAILFDTYHLLFCVISSSPIRTNVSFLLYLLFFLWVLKKNLINEYTICLCFVVYSKRLCLFFWVNFSKV